MIYQDTNLKICLSLFGWKENILPKMHIVQMSIDNADYDNVAYEEKQFTTTTTEHSFCLSCWSSWSCSSRDMIQTVRGREIAVAIPDIRSGDDGSSSMQIAK